MCNAAGKKITAWAANTTRQQAGQAVALLEKRAITQLGKNSSQQAAAKTSQTAGKALTNSSKSRLNTRFVGAENGIIHDVQPTLKRISSGQKFPHRNDGSIFENREKLLPKQPKDYYREFVHASPSVKGAGTHRIVVGKG